MQNDAFHLVKGKGGEGVVIAENEGDNSAKEGGDEHRQKEFLCSREVKNGKDKTHQMA